MVAADGRVGWTRGAGPDAHAGRPPTREQIPEMTRFKGGEGIWYDGGVLYFATKSDRKI